MNPTQTQPMFKDLIRLTGENMAEREELEQPGETTIQFSPEQFAIRSESIKNDWTEFYHAKAEEIAVEEKPVSKIEMRHIQNEVASIEPKSDFGRGLLENNFAPTSVIEQQKGSGSLLEETGIVKDLTEKTKGVFKSLVGGLSLFGEIFLDTITLVAGKKEKSKKVEKPETDPEKAKAAAEKKAENQRKQNNIRAFYEGLKAQIPAMISTEAARMDTQEKANINAVGKIGQESYKGIKDSFGRVTVYAASLFQKGQEDQEKQAKKSEKENKLASIAKSGPDLNMDKVAEGGYLSATGGQGAG